MDEKVLVYCDNCNNLYWSKDYPKKCAYCGSSNIKEEEA